MTPLLIALAIVALFAILPLGFSLRYDASGAAGRLIVGPMQIVLFPRPKKEKKAKKDKRRDRSNSDKRTDAALADDKPKRGGSLTDFRPLVRIALDFLDGLRRRLRVNWLELKIILAGDDPCDLALSYGRAWEAVGNLMPRLERFLVIKKRNIEVECDFQETQTRVIARIDLTITLGRIFVLAAVYGVRVLLAFLKIRNQRKGGAVHEQKSS